MATTALLVMEMQTDYFWEKRLKKFHYDGDALIAKVNAAIAEYSANGADIVYLRQVFPDTPTNRLAFGFNIIGTEGAALDPRLNVVSEHVFGKNISDLFADPQLAAFFEQQDYTEFVLCGIDLCGGIVATAKGARAKGAAVTVLTDCCGTRFDTRRIGETKAALRMSGVQLK